MNSKGRSSAAWCAEPQPVETGLSVDDRPNELNIAFWVISSVGAASPLLLHIIYVSVRAPSLSFSISLALSFHAPPPTTHTNTSLSLSLALCVAYSFSLSPFLSISSLRSIFFLSLHLSVPWYPSFSFLLSHSFSAFFPHSFSLVSLPLSPSPLLFSLSLPPFVSLPPSAAPCFFFLSDTLWAFFSLKLSFPLSLSFFSLSFSLPISLPLISEPCLWSSITLR